MRTFPAACCLAALAALAGCGGTEDPPADACASSPNVTLVTLSEESGGRQFTGNACGSCNGGLLKVKLQDNPSLTFQIQLLQEPGTWAIPTNDGFCPTVYWDLDGGGSADPYTDGVCGVAAPTGVSGTLEVGAAPGSGSCTGKFTGRLYRYRAEKDEWVNVSLEFGIREL